MKVRGRGLALNRRHNSEVGAGRETIIAERSGASSAAEIATSPSLPRRLREDTVMCLGHCERSAAICVAPSWLRSRRARELTGEMMVR